MRVRSERWGRAGGVRGSGAGAWHRHTYISSLAEEQHVARQRKITGHNAIRRGGQLLMAPDLISLRLPFKGG